MGMRRELWDPDGWVPENTVAGINNILESDLSGSGTILLSHEWERLSERNESLKYCSKVYPVEGVSTGTGEQDPPRYK